MPRAQPRRMTTMMTRSSEHRQSAGPGAGAALRPRRGPWPGDRASELLPQRQRAGDLVGRAAWQPAGWLVAAANVPGEVLRLCMPPRHSLVLTPHSCFGCALNLSLLPHCFASLHSGLRYAWRLTPMRCKRAKGRRGREGGKHLQGLPYGPPPVHVGALHDPS